MTEDNKKYCFVLLVTILCNLESVAGFASSVFFCWSTSLVSEIAHSRIIMTLGTVLSQLYFQAVIKLLEGPQLNLPFFLQFCGKYF